MTDITNHHIIKALGAKGAKKARKRRTGGDANDNGHAFEKAFTMNAILREIRRSLRARKSGRDVRFKSQPLGFIDDLVILRKSQGADYFELKSGSTQRCTTALKYNIVRQQQVILRNHLQGTINLVLHNELADDRNVQQRAHGIPVCIMGFEESRFEDYELIIAALPDLSDSYLLITLRALLYGAWYHLHRDATVKSINTQWRYMAVNRVHSTTPIGVSHALATFFESIGLILKDERDVLRFKINKLSGLFFFQVGSATWSEFENYLLDAWPTDPMVVHNIIERFNHG
ncbi:hypothetical protein OLZ32_08005 [Rhizobium sp. 1AS11]|uniref:hypothetical protein n=1 Tax=Rhizobium acaciae TaxID=2989736 RepID=UPI002222DB71|nr:hypothetical protein [Rhizobium acaciae]MCW1408204.1 hypothetical protein [Rhizobium acaciae]MCW1740355.1 hypothetical protein [Rhizobium acaciae]